MWQALAWEARLSAAHNFAVSAKAICLVYCLLSVEDLRNDDDCLMIIAALVKVHTLKADLQAAASVKSLFLVRRKSY